MKLRRKKVCQFFGHPVYVTHLCRVTNDRPHLLSRCFTKLFRTGSVTVLIEYQMVFHFLPTTNQVYIRAAKFLRNLWQTKMPFARTDVY